jgi:transmembrane sensor
MSRHRGMSDADLPDANPNLTDDRLWALLDRFLAGECTAEEASEVHGWLAADRANHDLLDAAQHIRRIAAERPPARSADSAWRRAVAALDLEGSAVAKPGEVAHSRVIPPRFSTSSLGRRRRASRLLASGAALAAGIAVAVLAVRAGRRPASPHPPVNQQPPGHTYATARAQRAIVRLSDGTQVVLGPESRLDVPVSFGDLARDVALVGEAYFSVIHDSTKPFRVRAGGTVTEDVGTAFAVRAYPTDGAVRVVVAEGAVKLGLAALHARDMAVIDTAGRAVITHDIVVDRYIAWTDGRLVLDGVQLTQAAAELSRWYDLDVRLTEPALGRVHVTGSFGREPVDEVLEALTRAAGLRYARQGRVVTIR